MLHNSGKTLCVATNTAAKFTIPEADCAADLVDRDWHSTGTSHPKAPHDVPNVLVIKNTH